MQLLKKMIPFFLFAILPCCGFVEETSFVQGGVAPAGPAWWNTSWSYRRQLTFDNSTQIEDLVDFPVLVRLDSTRIDYGKTRDSGQDIRFVDQYDTQLSHEIELWDESGDSWVWVKVPLIGGGSAEDSIWMYYGNASAPDEQDAAGVWSNGYELVLHLDEPSGDFEDSTGNGHYGEAHNGVTRAAAGKTGKAAQFDGGDDYISLNMSYTGSGAIGQLTVCVWFSTTFSGASYNDNWAFIDFDRSDFYDFYITGDTGSLEFSTTATGTGTDDFTANTSGLNDGGLRLGWALYDGVDKYIYLNNILDGTVSNPHNGSGLGISSTRWGFVGDGSEATTYDSTRNNIYYEGLIDEVRISNIARSSDWINAQYLSMNDGFISVGAEE
jgi:hypothetical protein